MGVSRTYKSPKWSKRFCNSLDSNPISFDGITDGGHTKTTDPGCYEALNLEERWGCLASRIAEHGCFPRSYYPYPFSPTLPAHWLAWNKNPQCPPKTWDELLSKGGRVTYKECKADSHKRICVKWYNTETYTFVFCFCEDPKSTDWKPVDKDPNRCRAWESTGNQKSLILPRHNPYEKSLEIADYVSSYFPPRWPDAIIAYEGNTTQEPRRNYGFWLIDENYADFVYAILKSSMFRAWCKLTANSKGCSHFTIGMWDTFPLPYLSPCNEKFIIDAAKYKNWDQLNVLIDKLFVPGISNPLQDSLRLQILAEGFLDAFYGA